jgi:hypothetical protein
MQNNRLGCLTVTGIISVFITSCAILGFALFGGGQMFSAGALNSQPGDTYGGVTSHAQITACSDCHVFPLGAQTMADRCAACHTDIAEQMKDVAKLHGAIKQKSSAFACYDCHPEHRGKTASLTDMGENTFPHETLGFSLKGHRLTAAREAFSCTDCHHEDIKTFSAETCDSCHRQMDIVFTQTHVLSFGTDCLACHDGVDRFGKNFNHSTFTFKLDGKHAEAACTKCHLNARTIADLQSAPQDCFACHRQDDEHDGRFGQDCSACHSPDGWEPANFDHNLSAFKLEGEHAEAKCEQCHVDNVFKGTPTDCYSCHQKDDEHNGAFGTDCGGCHTPNDWEGATFDHNLSRFPLTGAHIEIRCEQCHTGGQFKGLDSSCVSCHADPDFHVGAFSADCASCHNTSSWLPATFNLRHPEPQVDEEGSGIYHGGATCRQCHPATVYQSSCVACHENGFEDGEGGDD